MDRYRLCIWFCNGIQDEVISVISVISSQMVFVPWRILDVTALRGRDLWCDLRITDKSQVKWS
jgi:hypothetical protein